MTAIVRQRIGKSTLMEGIVGVLKPMEGEPTARAPGSPTCHNNRTDKLGGGGPHLDAWSARALGRHTAEDGRQ